MDGIDRVDGKSGVNGVNRVIWVNPVIRVPAGKFISQVPAEGLVQQRLLQRLQCGFFSVVNTGEAMGFFTKIVEVRGELLFQRVTSSSADEYNCWVSKNIHPVTESQRVKDHGELLFYRVTLSSLIEYIC